MALGKTLLARPNKSKSVYKQLTECTYIYIYIYIYIHIIYKKSHALTEMILLGFLYLQAFFPWPWKLTFSRVSHRLFSNPLSLSKPMPPMEKPPPPHIHTHTHTHLKMNLPPPTEKRNPILKSEAPFQDMIPRKRNTKNESCH